MKKLALVVLFVLGVGISVARADLAIVNLKIISLDIQGVSALGFVDFFHQSAIFDAGIVTVGNINILNQTLDLGVGGITGPTNIGSPIGSIGYTWKATTSPWVKTVLGIDTFTFGGGVSYNFASADPVIAHNWMGGLTVSTNIISDLFPSGTPLSTSKSTASTPIYYGGK